MSSSDGNCSSLLVSLGRSLRRIGYIEVAVVSKNVAAESAASPCTVGPALRSLPVERPCDPGPHDTNLMAIPTDGQGDTNTSTLRRCLRVFSGEPLGHFKPDRVLVGRGPLGRERLKDVERELRPGVGNGSSG
jgi:hypothetical protein